MGLIVLALKLIECCRKINVGSSILGILETIWFLNMKTKKLKQIYEFFKFFKSQDL